MKDLEKYLEFFCTKFNVEKERVFYIIEELRREEFLSKPNLLPPRVQK